MLSRAALYRFATHPRLNLDRYGLGVRVALDLYYAHDFSFAS